MMITCYALAQRRATSLRRWADCGSAALPRTPVSTCMTNCMHAASCSAMARPLSRWWSVILSAFIAASVSRRAGSCHDLGHSHAFGGNGHGHDSLHQRAGTGRLPIAEFISSTITSAIHAAKCRCRLFLRKMSTQASPLVIKLGGTGKGGFSHFTSFE